MGLGMKKSEQGHAEYSTSALATVVASSTVRSAAARRPSLLQFSSSSTLARERSASSRMPVPLAVLFHFMFGVYTAPPSSLTEDDATSASSTTVGQSRNTMAPLQHLVEVEVECKQGYVYTGTLLAVDAYYNLTLGENTTVRRQRQCDVERQLIREKYTSLLDGGSSGGSSSSWGSPTSSMHHADRTTLHSSGGGLQPFQDLLPPELVERPHSPALPTYIGTTMIRSSHIFMIRFLSSSTAVAALGSAELDPSRQREEEEDRSRGGASVLAHSVHADETRGEEGAPGSPSRLTRRIASPVDTAWQQWKLQKKVTPIENGASTDTVLSGSTSTSASSRVSSLESAFRATAVGVKKAMAKQRDRDRAERRQRLNLTAKKTKEEVKKTAAAKKK